MDLTKREQIYDFYWKNPEIDKFKKVIPYHLFSKFYSLLNFYVTMQLMIY